jgi:hypothetical protein
MAEKILAFLLDGNKAAEAGKINREIINNKFGYGSFIEQTESVLAQIL